MAKKGQTFSSYTAEIKKEAVRLGPCGCEN